MKEYVMSHLTSGRRSAKRDSQLLQVFCLSELKLFVQVLRWNAGGLLVSDGKHIADAIVSPSAVMSGKPTYVCCAILV